MSSNGKPLFLRRTVIYGLAASILGYLIYSNDYTLGALGNFLPMSPQTASISLEIILIPLLASITIFYLASIVVIVFEGILAEVLAGTFYAAGFASFFALFLILNPAQNINQAGYLLSAAFGVALVYNVVSTLARLRKSPTLKVVAVSATIYTEGQIALRLISLLIGASGAAMTPGLIEAILEFLSLGITIAAVFTLLAVFKTSGNPYLAALGSIASNYIFSVSLSIIGALYYGFFMGGLSSFAPSIANLSPYVEWTGICIFAAIVFTIMRRGMQGSIMVKNRQGEWKKHVQQVTTYKGDRFVGFTEVVDDFVEYGNREKLLVKLALFLYENQARDDNISELLSELINYEDEEVPALSRTGQSDVVESQNKLRRLDLLQRMIRNIVPQGTSLMSTKIGGEIGQSETSIETG